MAESNLPVYVNGKIVSAEEARVSVFDRGFMRGDGLFETLRTYGGRPFRLDDHLARLDSGLEILRFPARSVDLDLKAAIEETNRASGIESARVRVQITRGVGGTGFDTSSITPPTVVISVQPMGDEHFEPLDVIVSQIRRDERSPLARVKTVNYIPAILARMEAEDAGANDAILLNYAGNVAEACAANVFLVHSGKLLTPDLGSGVLEGITRRVILEIAHDLNLPTFEQPIEGRLLEEACEIFLTSSTREVAPAATLNGRTVGKGSHDLAELIEAEYRKRTGP